jgi:TonB family protein
MAASAMTWHGPQPDGLQRSLTVSFAVHVAVIVALFLVPREWLSKRQPDTQLMNISLGSAGARTGGLNAAGAQPIEEVAPPPKRAEPERAVPPKPEPPTPSPAAKPTTSKPIETAATRTPKPPPPLTGRQVQQGSARAATMATGQNTGLATGGGAGGGAFAQFDPNFCCPEYVDEMLRRISANWKRHQPEAGTTTIKFTINRDGSFSKPEIEKSSGSVLLDLNSKQAFDGLRLPPLPAAYTEQNVTIHLSFPYVR